MTIRKISCMTISFSTALTASANLDAGCVPAAKHFDVWLRIVDGDMVTGAIEEDETPICPSWRVFGAEFGQDPQFPRH